jgi:hypothetical protein
MKQRETSKKDLIFWTSINNSKRLIPKYAREEREQFRARLEELGLTTAAQKQRQSALTNKNALELFDRLEQNLNRHTSKLGS